MRWLGIIAAGLLLGCGPRYASDEQVSAPHAAVAPVSGDIYLGLVTCGERGPAQNALRRPLHTGDRVAVIVQLPTPRYVYLMNIPPEGRPLLLSPHGDPEPIEGVVRLPHKGWFELAEPHGLELLGLLLSRERIALDAHGLKRIVEQLRRTARRGDLVKYQGATPPGFSTGGYASMGIRAASLALDDGALRIGAAADEVVVLMDIDHRTRRKP